MLHELRDTRQIRGEPSRRWFASKTMDLIVWSAPSGQTIAFQICYDKDGAQKALTWREGAGFSHCGVDDGEGGGGLGFKQTPILTAGGHFDLRRIAGLFNSDAGAIPPDLHAFVSARLAQPQTR